jgi:uncharacterized protein (UPF0248 family)
MIPIKEFLNKIKWSGKFDPKIITIFYYDRILNKLIPVKYENIKIDKDFLIVEDKQIPLHRVREIRSRNIIIWKR